MITKEKIQEQYLKEKKFSYMNPMVANIDYVKWLETELISVKKQLPINGVVNPLNVSKTNPNFEEWLQTHDKFKDNTYVWGMGYVMSYADMKAKHKELIELNI